MIVLETISDYVRYGIEPEDSTMLASYKRRIISSQRRYKTGPKAFLDSQPVNLSHAQKAILAWCLEDAGVSVSQKSFNFGNE